jgi:Topoisomerase II-associated protein PAT1
MGWSKGHGPLGDKVGPFRLSLFYSLTWIFYSNPHPFISLIAPSKGKKLLPRVSRHLSSQQMLTVLTLLVACFSQMDIVSHARILDLPEENTRQQDLERQTQAFLGSVVQSILPVVAKAGLRLVSGLLGLLLERSDIVSITQTRVCSPAFHLIPPADPLFVARPSYFDIVSQPGRTDQTIHVNCRGSFGTSNPGRNRAMVRVIRLLVGILPRPFVGN